MINIYNNTMLSFSPFTNENLIEKKINNLKTNPLLKFIDYHTRINLIDKILSVITDIKEKKFILLSLLHYGLLSILYLNIYFTTKSYFLKIILLILIIQIIFNVYDDGCFLMKLERKYIGKGWYGPYSLINDIYPNTINEKTMPNIFKILSILSVILVIYKIYKLEK